MIKIWNHKNKNEGRKLAGRDALLIRIPKIGSYIEVDDKLRLSAQNIVDNSFGSLSFAQPSQPIVPEELSLIETLRAEKAELLARLATLEDVGDLPKTKSKKVAEVS